MENGRIETKYLIKDTSFVREILLANFLPDEKYPFNHIFTLHFDTYILSSYFDKLNGAFYKDKIRIRWYSDRDEFFIPKEAYLENKTKRLDRSFKHRMPIDLSDNLRKEVFSSLYWNEIIIKNKSYLKFWPDKHIFPVMISCYRRYRFHDPFSYNHISLDDNIRMYQINPSMAHYGNIYPALDEGVLEIKGQSSYLPICLENMGFLSMSSFSKYAALLTKYTGGRNE